MRVFKNYCSVWKSARVNIFGFSLVCSFPIILTSKFFAFASIKRFVGHLVFEKAQIMQQEAVGVVVISLQCLQ